MPGCPACAALDVDPVYAPAAWGIHRLVRCRHCGLTRTEPQPHPDTLLALYGERRRTPPAVKMVRRAFTRMFAARAVRGLGAGGRVLDIGCGDGALLVSLAARGFTGVGTELPGRYPRRPGTPGITISEGTDVADLHLAAGSCRLVVARHALEHLRDPAAALREARRILDPSGRLVVAVPNLASWQSRRAGAHWFHLDVPRHLVHFTPATLRALVRGAGFTIERTTQLSFEHGPYGWLQSLLNVATHPYSRPRDATKSGNDLVAIGLAIALLPVCVALTVLEALAGHGAVIELRARPACDDADPGASADGP